MNTDTVNQISAAMAFVALVLMAAPPVFAADGAAGRERQMIERLQNRLQAAETMKSTLLQEKTALEQKLADITREYEALKSTTQKSVKSKEAAEKDTLAVRLELESCQTQALALQAQLENANVALTQANGELKITRQAFSEISTAHSGLQEQLKLRAADVMQLASMVDAEKKSWRACAEKNATLYKYSLDLLQRYQDKGFLDVLLNKEAVTQLRRVEMENLAQEYREKMNNALVSGDHE